MQEYLDMWKGYVDFSGRTSVKGFWMAALIHVVVSIVVGFVASAIKLPFLATIYSLAVFLPWIAIMLRRLRDSGRNPVWILIAFAPCVGWIMLIIFLAKPSINQEF